MTLGAALSRRQGAVCVGGSVSARNHGAFSRNGYGLRFLDRELYCSRGADNFHLVSGDEQAYNSARNEIRIGGGKNTFEKPEFFRKKGFDA